MEGIGTPETQDAPDPPDRWTSGCLTDLVIGSVVVALLLVVGIIVAARLLRQSNMMYDRIFTERIAMAMAIGSRDAGEVRPADVLFESNPDMATDTANFYGHGLWHVLEAGSKRGWIISLGADGVLGGDGQNLDVAAWYTTEDAGDARPLNGEPLRLFTHGQARQLPGRILDEEARHTIGDPATKSDAGENPADGAGRCGPTAWRIAVEQHFVCKFHIT